MTTLTKPHLEIPITERRQLTEYLLRGAKPRENWGIGIETEKLVIDSATGEAVSYDRIEDLLRRLSEKTGWEPILENGRIVALKGPASSLTLEPGGQLELSGSLCPDIECCRKDFLKHVEMIVAEGEPLGLSFLGLGVHPFTRLDDIDWVPKNRYAIMAPYMLRTGDMGQRMMKQTASLQVNLDFSDEEDCVDKIRVAQALSPLLYALFANSPIMEDRPTGFLSTRGEIWRRTDSDRTGLIYRFFEEDADLGTYVDYALDVPMYFIFRDGTYIDCTRERFPFRRFLSEGFAGHGATVGDWDLHLSTLFPEVRLRPQIEIRSIDSLSPRHVLAPAALLKSILYDDEARREIWNLYRPLDRTALENLYTLSWKHGLKTPFGNRRLQDVAQEILSMASALIDASVWKCESSYLEEMGEMVRRGESPAERLLSDWKGSRKDKLALLKRHCGFTAKD